MSRTLPPALPRQQDGALCPTCLAMPRQAHTLSCPEVSQQQFAAFLAWNPEARPACRGRLAAIAGLIVLTSLPWAALAALLIWSLR